MRLTELEAELTAAFSEHRSALPNLNSPRGLPHVWHILSVCVMDKTSDRIFSGMICRRLALRLLQLKSRLSTPAGSRLPRSAQHPPSCKNRICSTFEIHPQSNASSHLGFLRRWRWRSLCFSNDGLNASGCPACLGATTKVRRKAFAALKNKRAVKILNSLVVIGPIFAEDPIVATWRRRSLVKRRS